MRMHVVQHVHFEGPALIAEWAAERDIEVTRSLALSEEYPDLSAVDFVVLMGGPMDADDHAVSPWLAAEKAWVSGAVAAGKLVLGICLGAQIVAEVLGGEVRRNPYCEIGWFPVRRTPEADEDPAFWAFPQVLIAGHWHGDTFALPAGIAPALSSDATANQAFSFDDGRVVGLQFHIEWTAESLAALVDESLDDLDIVSPYVRPAQELLAGVGSYGGACRAALWKLLDAMATRYAVAGDVGE